MSMNSRRRLLQFFGLGSLFATATAVTPSQASASNHPKMKWKHRIVRADLWHLHNKTKYPHEDMFPVIEDVMDRETQDGWELVHCELTIYGGDQIIVLRKQVQDYS